MARIGGAVISLSAWAIFVAIVVAFGYGTFRLIWWVEDSRCAATATQMGTTHIFDMWTLCMVRHNGQWVPLKNLRVL